MKIWATLGPSSYDKIKELESAGVDMFRLNLSHVDMLTTRIRQIQDATDLPICVDTDCGKYTKGRLNEFVSTYGLKKKDVREIDVARNLGIKWVALSFANIKDVREIRTTFPSMVLVSKIEHLPGLRDIAEIASYSGALLIDRGDLSRSVDMAKIPDIQKHILRRFPEVYVATNLIDSMIALRMVGIPVPTVGEVNDIWNTLCDGARGLVLAAETAIGKYPVESVKEVKKVIDEFERKQRKYIKDFII